MTSAVLLGILELFILFGLGFLARKLKLLNSETIGSMSKVILDILLPLLIFQSIVQDFVPGRLNELWPLPLIGFAFMFCGGAAAFLFDKGLKTDHEETKRTFRHLCAVNNYVFLPLILIQRLVGDTGVALLFFLTVGSTLGFWTVGIGLLGKGGGITEIVKQLITPALAAILIAFIVSISGLAAYIPDFLLNLFERAGDASVQILLILIGASWLGLTYKGDMWNQIYLALVRLIILPGLFILVLTLLNLSKDVFVVAFIVAIMPVSSQSPIITARYGGSPAFASRAIISTTLLSAVTIPLWVIIILG